MSGRLESDTNWPLLIVDADPEQRRSLRILLAHEGYRVTACGSAEEAGRLGVDHEWLVAVVDEPLSGESICARGDPSSSVSAPPPAVVVHTRDATLESVKKSLNVGVFAFVEKRADTRELIRQVRRAAEQRLAAGSQALSLRRAALFEAVVDGILVLEGPERVIVDANAAATRMLGFSLDALIGLGISELETPVHLERARGHERPPVLDGRLSSELELRRADGSEWTAELTLSPLDAGSCAAQICILRDVSDRKAVEAAPRESEARLGGLFDHSPVAMALFGTDGRLQLASHRFAALVGEQPEALRGKALHEIYSTEYADVASRHSREVLSTGEAVASEEHLVVSGTAHDFLTSRFPVFDAEGSIIAIGCVATDITEHKRTQAALEQSEERFQGLFDNAPDVYLTVGPDGVIHSVNQFGADYLGYRKNELVGRPVWELLCADDRERVRGQILKAFAELDAMVEAEFRIVTRDGCERWVHGRTRMEPGGEGDGAELRIVCRDVTEAHDLSRELTYQATHDSLTGLVNRRELESRLGRVLDTAKRSDSEHALCYVDLDQFKVINDTCGHVAGDELLRQLGELLPARVRRRDTLARLGGDEFAVLMEHCSLMQARRVANALRRAIAEFRFSWEGKAFSVGASIGLAPITSSSNGVADVLSAADTACYVAKDQGRNRIHVYHEDDVELIRRHGEMEWVSRLNWAFDESRFELYCQPIQPLQPEVTGTGLHLELLLRMRGEDEQIVPPGAFLPAAERYNMSGRIDRWVVAETLDWLSRSASELPPLAMCSVNLSGTSIADDEFLKFVVEQLDRCSISPALLCFEITETAAIANLTSATRFIAALKGWGCQFALDDFGSGLSSFAYLKHLAVDFLKIDGVFVKDVASDPIDFAMVKSINEVGRVMGKKTIAEFAEKDEIIDTLREIGVDYAQGYAISSPVPLSEIGDLSVRVRSASASR